MFAFLVCLLSASALAVDYNSYLGQQQQPYVSNYAIDGVKEGLTNIFNPNTNFFYNFEHYRRDQPPHVEQREENLGKYFYRSLKTTSTSTSTTPLPSPFIPQYSTNSPEYELPSSPNVIPNSLDFSAQQWNQLFASTTTTLPPSSSTAKWLELIRAYQQNISTLPDGNQNNLQENQYKNLPIVVPTQAPAWINRQEYNDNHLQSSLLPFAPTLPTLTSSQTPRVSATESHMPISPKNQQDSQSMQNRGSYKFKWTDMIVSDAPEVKITQTTLSPLIPNSPPPVQTLSPWQDGFKK